MTGVCVDGLKHRKCLICLRDYFGLCHRAQVGITQTDKKYRNPIRIIQMIYRIALAHKNDAMERWISGKPNTCQMRASISFSVSLDRCCEWDGSASSADLCRLTAAVKIQNC